MEALSLKMKALGGAKVVTFGTYPKKWKKPPISKTHQKAYNFELRDRKGTSPRIAVQNFGEIVG